MAKVLRPRRGTKSKATSENPVLDAGEMFLQYGSSDDGNSPGILFVGDGATSLTLLSPFITDPSIYIPKFEDPTGPSTQNAASYEWGASTTSIYNIGDGDTNAKTLPDIIKTIKETLIHNLNSIAKINRNLTNDGFATTATGASGLYATTYSADKLSKSYRDTNSILDCYGLSSNATSAIVSGSSTKTYDNTATLISRPDQTYVICKANGSTSGSGSGGAWGDWLHSEISMNSAYTSYDKEDTTYISIINASTYKSNGSSTYKINEIQIRPADIIKSGGWGLSTTINNLNDYLKYATIITKRKTYSGNNNNSIAVNANDDSFICWVGISTTGYTVAGYFEDPTKASTNIWTQQGSLWTGAVVVTYLARGL